MAEELVFVNRAPVLTLWAAVVAERLGYDPDAALTLGRALAGLNAQSKGRALGIYHERERAAGEERRAPPPERRVDLLGRAVPATDTPEGLRATADGRPIDPKSVESYLDRSFGESLGATVDAFAALAGSYPPERLAEVAYDLYERFRPAVAPGHRGWGQKGVLDLEKVRSLAAR